MRRRQGSKPRKQKEKKKEERVEDPTLHPSLHAYTDHNGRCWYCGCEVRQHGDRVTIQDGKRLVVPVR